MPNILVNYIFYGGASGITSAKSLNFGWDSVCVCVCVHFPIMLLENPNLLAIVQS